MTRSVLAPSTFTYTFDAQACDAAIGKHYPNMEAAFTAWSTADARARPDVFKDSETGPSIGHEARRFFQQRVGLQTHLADLDAEEDYDNSTSPESNNHRPMDNIFSGWMTWVNNENPGVLGANADAVNAATDFFYSRLQIFTDRPPPAGADLGRTLAIIIRRSSSVAEVRRRILADARFQDRHPIVDVITETSGV